MLSRHEDYPPRLVERVLPARGFASHERLAVYHRQYWFRLLDVLQQSFPLTTRVLGHYHFNGPASHYFQAHPPQNFELDRDADGFADFLRAWLAESGARDAEYVSGALQLDVALREVFSAPEVEPFALSAELAPFLASLQLVKSPERRLYRQAFPFLEERERIVSSPGEERWPRLEPLATPAHFLVAREGKTLAHVRLEPREARLYELLGAHPVGEALGQWEEELLSGDEGELASLAEAYLAKSIARRVWSGALVVS